MSKRTQRIRHRPSRTLAASVTALVLLAAGVALVWISVLRLSIGAWPGFVDTAARSLPSLTWNSPIMWTVAVITAVLGLILLLAAIIPGKHNGIRLQATHDGSTANEVVLSRRGIVRLANAEAGRMDGVLSSKAKAKGRRVKMTVTSPLREPGDLRQRVTDSVDRRFHSIGLKPHPKVNVVVRSRDV